MWNASSEAGDRTDLLPSAKTYLVANWNDFPFIVEEIIKLSDFLVILGALIDGLRINVIASIGILA